MPISLPGTKTPNLVARLMGLDLLPERTSSPSSDSTRTVSFDNKSVRSLPETPRMSMSSARRSDSDYHRLSLQINRENIKDEIKRSAKIRAKRRFRENIPDENRSPRRYAKQIVKKIKETVSRRVGLDITNMARDDIRRDENLILKKNFDEINKQSGMQSPQSPKLRFSDINRNKQVTNSDRESSRNSAMPSDNRPSKNFQVTLQGTENSCSRNNRAIGKAKEVPYVGSTATNAANLRDKKFKKVPTSKELPVKKHPSPPATKLPQKQVSSKTRHTYKKLHLESDRILTGVEPGGTIRWATAEYRRYIERILNRAGIVDDVTPLSLGKWHTASHLLDPSIFYYLELFQPLAAVTVAVLSQRCNRKLIFQLVDELLSDILKLQLDSRPWISISHAKNNSALVDRLCNTIEGFPAANCEVLEDIDSLIGADLHKTQLIEQFEEEREGLVNELEDELVNFLVSETAAMVVGVGTMQYRTPQ